MRRFVNAIATLMVVGCADDAGMLEKQQSSYAAAASKTLTVPGPYVTRILGPASVVDCIGRPRCTSAQQTECCNSSTQQRARSSSGLAEETVFFPEVGEVGKPQGYRIPAFVQVPGGPQFAFAEERYHNLFCNGDLDFDSGYIRTVVKVRSSPEEAWSSAIKVCDFGAAAGDTCGNPTPVYDAENDRLVILLNRNPGHKTNKSDNGCPKMVAGDRRVLAVVSSAVSSWETNGITFSTPRDISCAVQKSNTVWDCAGPGNGVDLGDGALVFPACGGRNIYYDPAGGSPTEVINCGDLSGSPWSYEVLEDANSSEGALVRMNDGLLMRSDRANSSWIKANQEFRRRAARQLPDGDWTDWFHEGQPLSAGSNGCQASIRRFSAGAEVDRLIYSAPATSESRWGLALRVSYNEGDTWVTGRELIPATDDNYTGYSSTDRVGDHVGILFERTEGYYDKPDDERVYSLSYLEASLSYTLCGRREPMLIGGNAWLGDFERQIVRQSGVHEYWAPGTLNGDDVDVFVKSNITSRLQQSQATVSVAFSNAGPWQSAVVQKSTPGVFALAGGGEVKLDKPPPGKAWCNTGY